MSDEIHRKYHEVANIFPLMQGEEFEALKNDIAEHGQREPIWLDTDGRIIDGRNRHRACCELGIAPKFTTWNGNGSLVYFVVSLNLHRRHLNSGQKAIIAVDILPLLEAEAKERYAKTVGRPNKSAQRIEQNTDKKKREPEATAKAAVIVGSNRQYISDAKKLVQDSPEVANLVRSGEITMPEAKSLAKMDDEKRAHAIELMQDGEAKSAKDAMKMVVKEQKAAIAQAAAKLPEKEYNVIYVDPPWEYSNTGVHGAAADHYGTMTIDEIADLPNRINLKVSKDAVMFMWITNPLMAEAFSLIEKWGFTYKTNIVWVKTELVKPGSGFYVRGRHELLFICTRGSFTPLDQNISPPIGSVVSAPIQEHSRKPEEFYTIIERLYPDCSYIELFARSKREKWDAWGNEITRFAETGKQEKCQEQAECTTEIKG